MAENSVTIALKLDASQFNASIAQAQSQLSSMGISGGRRGGGTSKSSSPLSGIDTVSYAKTGAKQESFLKRILGVNEKTAAQSVALMKGNFSAANTMGVMEGVLGGMAGSLGTLVLLAAAVVVGISAMQVALKPIMKILTAIGKVIGAVLIPISIVIMQLLKPVLFLLIPFIGVFKGFTKNLPLTIVKAAGAITNALIDIVGMVAKLIVDTAANVTKFLFDAIGFVVKAVIFLGALIVKTLFDIAGFIVKGIATSIAGIISSVVSVIAIVMTTLISVVQAALRLLPFGAGEGAANALEGSKADINARAEGINAAIESTLQTFNSGVDISVNKSKDTIDSFAEGMYTSIQSSVDTSKLAIDKFASTLDTNLTKSVKTSKDSINTFITSFAGLGRQTLEEANNIVRARKAIQSGTEMPAAASTSAEVAAAVAEGISAGNSTGGVAVPPTAARLEAMNAERVASVWRPIQLQLMAAGLAYGNPAYYVSGTGAKNGYQYQNVPGFNVAAALSTIQSGEYAKYIHAGAIGDGVITPSGQIVRTNPRDYIMATTDPGSMAGGNNTVININVEGNVDDKTAKYITQTVQREIAQAWRSIAR